MKQDKRITLVLVGATAAGVGLVAYYLLKRRMVEVQVQLEQSHVSWLQEVASKYTKGDMKRALQILIEHCQVSSKDSNTEKLIFEEVRCNACGGSKEKVDYSAVMTAAQLAFVKQMTKKHDIGGGEGKTLRIMFEYARDEVEEVAIFGQ